MTEESEMNERGPWTELRGFPVDGVAVAVHLSSPFIVDTGPPRPA